MRLLKTLCDHSSLCAIILCTCIISAISYTIEINKQNILVCVTQWSDAPFIIQELKLTSYMGVGVCRTQYVDSCLWMAEVQQSLWKSSELTAWSQLPRLSMAKVSIVTS